MQEIVSAINSWVWSPALIYLLLGVGLFFSILTRFVQARMFREMLRLLFSSKESDKGISSFQALSVSLSGRVGTGNIAGVAAAIGFGGPSAVFWMWVVAFLGSATAYVELALGQIYKEVDEGEYRGRLEVVRMVLCDLHDHCHRPPAAGRAVECHR
jgi:AGCS family alanine or glycine:cation symporter